MEAEMREDEERKAAEEERRDALHRPRTMSRIEQIGVRRPSSIRRTGL